jgi:hypothetical protein
MNIHPKATGAGLGGALGVLIAAVLHSISGVHLTAEAYAAIPTFLSTVFAYLAPSSQTVPVVVQMKPHDPPPVAATPQTPTAVQ